MKIITIKVLAFCLMFLVSKNTWADTYLDCFKSASKHYGVPFDLLTAVSFTESSFRAGAVNGRLNKNRSVDYGFMQINTLWKKVAERSGFSWYEIRHQPCANIKFGAWILRNNHRRLGSWSKAIGAYNAGFSRSSGAQARRAAYYQKVVRNKSNARRYLSRLKKRTKGSSTFPGASSRVAESSKRIKFKTFSEVEEQHLIDDYTPKPLSLSLSVFGDLSEEEPILLDATQ